MRSPVHPRREPRQDRSRFTVEAILEAATRVFDASGYEGTTNAVAERAGVSVGSLYQYFPSKDALLTALHERHVDQARAETLAVLAQMPAGQPVRMLEVLARRLIALHRLHPRLQLLLHEERRWLRPPSDESAANRALRGAVTDWLLASRTPVARADVATAAVVLMRQAESLVHAAVLEPSGATDGEMGLAIGQALAGYVLLPR
jgi:AcrR family transcriptional regulator